MSISLSNVKNDVIEATIVFVGVFLTICLYGLYAGDMELEKCLWSTLAICIILEMFREE